MPTAAVQTALTLNDSPLTSEAAEFYSILFHDDRKSHAVLAARRGGLWAEESLPCSQLAYLRSTFVDTSDHYITVNSFAGRRRDLNRCRQVNAIMFDIDAHDGSHAAAVPALRNRLDNAIADQSIPAPNIVVDTGRGLQVYYVFGNSIPYRLKNGSTNNAVLSFMTDVRNALGTLMERELVSHVPGAGLDKSVFDLTRVARIPGSFNSNAARRAHLVSTSRSYWDLKSLKAACGAQPAASTSKKQHSTRIYKFDRLQMMRMTKVEELVTYREQHGGCTGTRDLCLFVYYNSATQVLGPQEALQRAHKLNSKLADPLPKADIDQIARTVDEVTICHGPLKGKKGFYPLKKENIIAKLQLTAEEIAATDFFASKRETARQVAKQKTQSKRQERNDTICKLYGNGLSQKQVAAKIGCSLGTVSTVTSKAKIKRGSIKTKLKEQFKTALTIKNNKATSKVSNNWHTSWGCAVLSPVLTVAPSLTDALAFGLIVPLRI